MSDDNRRWEVVNAGTPCLPCVRGICHNHKATVGAYRLPGLQEVRA